MNKREKVLITGLFGNKRGNRLYNSGIDSIIEEAISLVESAGGEYVGSLVQKGREPDKNFFIGKGKVEEINKYIVDNSVDMILFLNQLSNVQQRNLEEKLDLKVIDRTRLILDIFALRARTLEGKLQVELAQLLYLLPRLTGKGIMLSRLGGGIGTRGPGETKLESDRRIIKKKITAIKKKLKKVRENMSLQRKQRRQSPVPLVSLVGYTSSGKSTLFNMMTGEDVFVTKRLFATLDPIVRRIDLSDDGSGYYCLLSDTVGFIRDMPQEVSEAFYATFEEVYESDIIVLMLDISGQDCKDHEDEVNKVLEQMGIDKDKIIKVYNKIDKLSEFKCDIQISNKESTDSIYISAKEGIGISYLKLKIFQKFFNSYEKFEISIDKNNPKIKNIEKWAIVHKKNYKDNFIHLEVLCKKEKMVKFLSELKEK